MMNSQKKINLKGLALFAFSILMLMGSCNDDLDNSEHIIEDAVTFKRHPNLLFSRADVGNLEKIGDRLYYSNLVNPGYFDSEGTQHFLAARSYDMRFSHSFSETLSAGVLSNRKSLIVMPNIGFSDTYTATLSPINIPDLPLDAQLREGWFEMPNFAFNENFLISNWDRNLYIPGMEPIDNTFILELNLESTSLGPNVNPFDPILRKIKLNLEFNGIKRFDIISAFTFKDGWVISGGIAGIQNSFFITREGEATPMRSLDERFVILSFVEGPTGELLLTTENQLYYSPEGDIYNLVSLGISNHFLRIQFIEDRLVAWDGRDNLYEILNYKDPENIEIQELSNLGLEGLWVKDIELFNNQIYVSTNGGLFLKDMEEFWTLKPDVDDEASAKLGWVPTH